MQSISTSLAQFTHCVENRIPIVREGDQWMPAINKEGSSLLTLLGRVCCLRKKEYDPVQTVFDTFYVALKEEEHNNVKNPIYADYLKVGNAVIDFLQNSDFSAIINPLHTGSYQKVASTKDQILNDALRLVVSLKYRIGAEKGGLDKVEVIDEDLCEKIKKIALRWKQERAKKVGFQVEISLTENDENTIREACRYPEFAKFLLKDEKLAASFFHKATMKYVPFDINGPIPDCLLNEKGKLDFSLLKNTRSQNDEELVSYLVRRPITAAIFSRPIGIRMGDNYII